MTYHWNGMNKITKTEALQRFMENKSLYLLFTDNTESLAVSVSEIEGHCGEFGYERAA